MLREAAARGLVRKFSFISKEQYQFFTPIILVIGKKKPLKSKPPPVEKFSKLWVVGLRNHPPPSVGKQRPILVGDCCPMPF